MLQRMRGLVARLPRSAYAILGRTVYGSILFIAILATLEDLGQIAHDWLGISQGAFHVMAVCLAAGAAIFEGLTRFTAEHLRDFFGAPDHIVEPPPSGDYEYRRAYHDEIRKIRALARERYGWTAFSQARLERWYAANPECFFVMVHNGQVVGYVDAFPISSGDYQSLLAGKPEYEMTPQRPEQVNESSSLYIASYVIKAGFEAYSLRLIYRAFRRYRSVYTNKCWERVCAEGFTPRGKALLEAWGMKRAEGDRRDVYIVDRPLLAHLSPGNRERWQSLLPAVALVDECPTPAPSVGV